MSNLQIFEAVCKIYEENVEGSPVLQNALQVARFVVSNTSNLDRKALDYLLYELIKAERVMKRKLEDTDRKLEDAELEWKYWKYGQEALKEKLDKMENELKQNKIKSEMYNLVGKIKQSLPRADEGMMKVHEKMLELKALITTTNFKHSVKSYGY